MALQPGIYFNEPFHSNIFCIYGWNWTLGLFMDLKALMDELSSLLTIASFTVAVSPHSFTQVCLTLHNTALQIYYIMTLYRFTKSKALFYEFYFAGMLKEIRHTP